MDLHREEYKYSKRRNLIIRTFWTGQDEKCMIVYNLRVLKIKSFYTEHFNSRHVAIADYSEDQDHPEKAKLLKSITRQQVAQTHMVQHHCTYKFYSTGVSLKFYNKRRNPCGTEDFW